MVHIIRWKKTKYGTGKSSLERSVGILLVFVWAARETETMSNRAKEMHVLYEYEELDFYYC